MVNAVIELVRKKRLVLLSKSQLKRRIGNFCIRKYSSLCCRISFAIGDIEGSVCTFNFYLSIYSNRIFRSA